MITIMYLYDQIYLSHKIIDFLESRAYREKRSLYQHEKEEIAWHLSRVHRYSVRLAAKIHS